MLSRESIRSAIEQADHRIGHAATRSLIQRFVRPGRKPTIGNIPVASAAAFIKQLSEVHPA